jgi:hypothetical protein
MEQSLERLRHDAGKCRELASTAMISEGRQVLSGLADQYEQEAMTLECTGIVVRSRRPAFKWPLA